MTATDQNYGQKVHANLEARRQRRIERLQQQIIDLAGRNDLAAAVGIQRAVDTIALLRRGSDVG